MSLFAVMNDTVTCGTSMQMNIDFYFLLEVVAEDKIS